MRLDTPKMKQGSTDRERTLEQQHQRATTAVFSWFSPRSSLRCLSGISHISRPAPATAAAPVHRLWWTPAIRSVRTLRLNRMRREWVVQGADRSRPL